MRKATRAWPLALLVLCHAAAAQTVVATDRNVAKDSPEGWAMRYFTGTTLLTSFGETARLAPWRWNVAADLGNIPQLSASQQRVVFGAFQDGDLNKSPIFGRLRAAVGLPYDWVAEVAYTPPLEIDGARPRNVFAGAIGRRIFDENAFTLSLRAVGQVGKVRGDITCPARVAGVTDPVLNPYGCQAPSSDAFNTDYWGGDATLGWNTGEWRWHASAGLVRTRLSVQVDALVFQLRDRSHLASDGMLRWFAIGTRYALDPHWSVAAEFLRVPLNVRRPPAFATEADPLNSVRVQLRYTID
jgi:hypothetical protein